MKTLPRRLAPARGTTLLELLFVVLIIGILALLILPVIGKAKARAKRTACVNNLHQMGIAHHAFAHDHGDKFPFQASTNDGGTLEFAQAGFAMSGDFYFAFRHFQALSNHLELTRLLVCPADTRTNADQFATLRNVNLSYFVGVNAEYSKPASILAGDRNISSETFGSGPILRLNPNSVQWTSGNHEFQGNVLFADGHVEHSDNDVLASTIQSAGGPVNNLLPPVTPPSGQEPIASEPTVVATRFFDSVPGTRAGGDAGNAAGNSGATPNQSPTAPAKQPEARPANVPKPIAPSTPTETHLAGDPKPVAPGPEMAALRLAAWTNVNTETNLSLAAQDAARPSTRASMATPAGTDPEASTGPPSDPYVFLFEPGRNLWRWLMVLVVVVLAAFSLGWYLYRSRSRRRLAAPGAVSRGA